MNIAIDAMGGDNAPLSNVKGAFEYLKHFGDDAANIILVGKKELITKELTAFPHMPEKVSVYDAQDIVGMDDSPAKIHRTKPNSSLVKSIKLVNSGDADAVISAGNTGALLSTSLFTIGNISGIKRPALSPFIPTNNGGFILSDAGANMECKAFHLVHFGIMASAYMEFSMGKKNPSVGLLNIGTEDNKGNELTRKAFPLMEEHINNFVGNIEARYILDGKVDIVICDGFVGNTVLKFIEGVIVHMMDWFKESIKSHPICRISAPLMAPAFRDMKELMNYETYGGTPFLGINGIVLKAHGSSSHVSIYNSLINAQHLIDTNLIENIGNRVASHLDIMD
ncbi:MAG: phosphate acyltransferase PlsX [Candidatus Marinimicrobia bacterium]|jgi:glycerol-3-phosphate acyltransferase PlsX|nr:phosphate acyltransferase PlsX [Candidatus Neomarinimicrobiota bacterium]MBT3633507.1 phosphate acyltransferase PlsX [Candidatus Neomarinimicrobiota bacterium]MBT3681649.1 phosphate acyltransferase PlsX [Candidatus Neomarinimicrobiota bacterium]MBT3758383.1 phosphate acyltransferase PlsX [Candidatus Neomarinimicrobiota bacterium]MBT3894963.1 phosphate acyltransferase PlsX [Candidatus Neomarinimicrobiota bacterium]